MSQPTEVRTVADMSFEHSSSVCPDGSPLSHEPKWFVVQEGVSLFFFIFLLESTCNNIIEVRRELNQVNEWIVF